MLVVVCVDGGDLLGGQVEDVCYFVDEDDFGIMQIGIGDGDDEQFFDYIGQYWIVLWEYLGDVLCLCVEFGDILMCQIKDVGGVFFFGMWDDEDLVEGCDF